MNTIHNRRKMIASALGAAAAAVAAPALLFTGAGTAQAQDCGDRVSAGPDTSCAFAQNVREHYVPFEREGSVVIHVYSPVTQETYAMNCVTVGTTDNYVTCRGGDNAEVSFPR
jgi:hypothetical protein